MSCTLKCTCLIGFDDGDGRFKLPRSSRGIGGIRSASQTNCSFCNIAMFRGSVSTLVAVFVEETKQAKFMALHTDV